MVALDKSFLFAENIPNLVFVLKFKYIYYKCLKNMDFAITIYLLNLKAYYVDRIILVNMSST